jgi:hypothetical protein
MLKHRNSAFLLKVDIQQPPPPYAYAGSNRQSPVETRAWLWFCAEEEDQARLGQGGYASAQSLRHPGQPFVQAEAVLCTLHELLQTPACSA